ncbi:FG-GAP repeat domain-containing protein [Streptomyces sp. NPDC012888]|uniref:FG-GAP repeat domain-containing protein n=1 Tax=Streptomyces sp. NPDC012888 TaxID=3364855 RepID=UPI0036BB6CBB
MTFLPIRRTDRVAACTALALSAGLVSAVPAIAAESPQPSAQSTVRAKARFDLDGDGRSERLTRSAVTGKLTVVASGTGTASAFTIGADDLRGASAKEILPADNLWGTAAPDLLTLHSDGTLNLHATVSPTATDKALVWQGSGWQIYNKVLAPGDLTRDGRQDLLARTPDGSLYLYAGKGTVDSAGPFKTRVKVGGGWNIYDQIVATNDLDGDTVADLVAKTLAGDLYFYKGTGSATAPFQTRVKVGSGWNIYNQIIGTDDVNDDGKADLTARAHSGAYYKYLSVGGGKFATRSYERGGGQYTAQHVNQGGVPDYGKHGLFTVDKAGTASNHATLANGTLAAAKQYGTAGSYGYHWSMGNGSALDQTDRANLLVATNPGFVSERDGVGHMISSSGAFYQYYERVAPGDVTGDGKGDVLGLDGWGNLFLHAGVKGGSGPQVGAAVKVGTGWPLDKLTGAGDVTGDGRPDLISRDGDRLYVHPGTGSAAAPFAARVLVGAGWGVYAHLAAPGDINGDGRADLVAVTTAGDVYRYTATGLSGTSTFAARTKIATGWLYDHVS